MFKIFDLIETDFIPKDLSLSEVPRGSFTWKTPSNIALVKYWGKQEPQIPKNASISFTLSNCFTETRLEYSKLDNERLNNSKNSNQYDTSKFNFDIYFEGEKKDEFKSKIEVFFKRIESYVPFLKDYNFVIRSGNSFPHSSGIASSASGMSALALCLMSMEKKMKPSITDDYFMKKASFLARLGSGSASRSIDGALVVWGSHEEIVGSSNLFGIKFPYKIHNTFKDYQDTILLVDEGEKLVSSSVGHQLMYNHPFAKQRFLQAKDHISKISTALKSGDIDEFVKIVEGEALSLHAMMMTSNPSFILMKPNTLEIIHKIRELRANTKIPVCFTLDAGANVHVLYPKDYKEKVDNFIQEELLQYCQNKHCIFDHTGKGALLISG